MKEFIQNMYGIIFQVKRRFEIRHLKYLLYILPMSLLFACSCTGNRKNTQSDSAQINRQTATSYKIVLETMNPEPVGNKDSIQVPGYIDTLTVLKLSEPLKAMAAFYSAIGGTMCNGDYCELTTALGLGKQGSEQHKNLIKKYFPADDKIAQTVMKQDCYLRPSGASSFSDYEFLTINDFGDTVKVDYNLWTYSRGVESYTKGTDIYLFKDKQFFKIDRSIWAEVDK